MASKKQAKPQMTEIKVIVYAIRYIESQIQMWEEKFAGKDMSDAGIKELKDGMIKPLQDEKYLLIQRYELEAGIEWCDG